MLDSFLPPWPTVYVFIFYCFVTNHHKLVVKNNTHLLPAHCDWVLCSGFCKAEINVLARLSSLLEALGKNLLSSSFKLLAESSSMRTELPVFLLTVGWRSLSAPRSCSQVLTSILTVENIFSHGIPLMLQISLISVSDL